jgi:hypothetical protein
MIEQTPTLMTVRTFRQRCRPQLVTALISASVATFELKPHEEYPGSYKGRHSHGHYEANQGLAIRAAAMACAHKDDPMNQLDEAEICERYAAATRARENQLLTVKDSATSKG